MRYTHDEEEFIILLAHHYEQDGLPLEQDKIIEALKITKERYDKIIRTLYNMGVFDMTEEGEGKPGQVIPSQYSVEDAREIQECRKNLTRHARLWGWAKNNRVLAPLIFVVEVAGPPIGLIGGILGVIALVRGC
ncbi:MAG: hypothetical protein KAV00_08755 [Phycisphaerae bacterium]|nr:hypothetical protein [Phycisphaerae bacterium]